MKPAGARHRPRRLPLRLRLILFSSGLVMLLSVALVLFVNLLVANSVPQIIGRASPVLFGRPHVVGQSAPPQRSARGIEAVPRMVRVREQQLNNDLVQNLWSISLAGLGLVAVLGCAGAYWGIVLALRPLRQVSRAAGQIGATTLDTRLALAGPADEITGLANAIDAMLERLEQAFAMQRRFVGDVSHELRTPLALLRTNLEVAAQDEGTTVLDLVRSQGAALARLERLVADLLLLARGEQPQELETEVSLGPLVEEVLDELAPTAAEHQVQVGLLHEGPEEVVVRGSDEGTLLARAVRNLVENAIVYNRPGGSVCVTVDGADGWASVAVADTGLGLTPAQQSQVFERFYRAEGSRARHTGGAGLGLSIVAAIARLHGGAIDVASTPGAGSTFTLRLPLAALPLTTL